MLTAPAPGGPSGTADDCDDRLQLILDAFTAMAAEDDEDGALERAVDVARLATRAVYGAAVLVGEGGISHLVHAGMTTRQVARLPHPPRGEGVLGAVLSGGALRLDALGEHPSSAGFPHGHVPMQAFLGVPVTLDTDEVLGAFYLGKPPGHPSFTDADEALVTALARQCAQVVVRLRAARQVRDLAARLEGAERVRGAAVARMTSGLDPVEAVDLLLDAVREQLGMPLAALMRLDPGTMEVQRTSGRLEGLEGLVGCSFPGPTLCHLMVAGEVGVVADLAAREDLAVMAPGIRAYAGAPVVVEGRLHGSLCVMSDAPTALTDADGVVLGVLADLVAHQLARLADDAAVRTAREAAVASALEPGGLRMVLQPVVDLVDGRVVSVEALARFPVLGTRPDLVFAEAASLGLGVDLELAAVDAATALLPLLPDEVTLSVNAGPATVEDPRLLERLAALPPGRVVLELTEHEDLGERAGLAPSLRRLRAAGTAVAIDDAGAGYAGLRSIVDVAPEVLKLDIGLVRGIDADPARRSLVRALVALAHDLDAVLVAEGVETAEELEALRGLGVRRAQGYFLGEPTAPGDADLSRRHLLALPAPRRGSAPLSRPRTSAPPPGRCAPS